jgi:hypothetical protein
VLRIGQFFLSPVKLCVGGLRKISVFWAMYSFVLMSPWGWRFIAETCRRVYVYGWHDFILFVCICSVYKWILEGVGKIWVITVIASCVKIYKGWSQWPRDLRRRSAAARLLGSWVRIPPRAWIFVSCECLCCQVEVSATSRSLVQRSPTDFGVCPIVIKWKETTSTPTMSR